MKRAQPILSNDVVLIGGGHAHALFLREWGMSPVEGVRLTVINPEPTAPYTGMLPGFVAGHYSRDELDIDLVKLARFAGARLVIGSATAIDRAAKRISVSGRPAIAYDIASIDIGITSEMHELSGYPEHGISAKPLGVFATKWRDFAESGKNGSVAIIGGGVAGVELALAMRHRLGHNAKISILESQTVLRGVGTHTKSQLLSELSDAAISLHENARLKCVGANSVHLEYGKEIPSTFTVGAAGARPHAWLSDTGLSHTNGFIDVTPSLRTVSDPSIYAVGDCSHMPHAPRSKAGVFAVRGSKVLFANIVADLAGGPRKRFNPQSKYLKLISLGRKAAIADKFAYSPSGAWAWEWKDRIDQAFMNRLNDLPQHGTTTPRTRIALSSKSEHPLCGGCGAKVGGDILASVLSRLELVERSDIEKSAGDDAAVLASQGARQVITTDHVRAFWSDPFVMTRIAAIHALNDVYAMGARPQAILAQITLPHMTDDLAMATLEECMIAANEVAHEVGATLVGGHTTMGAEFTVGFTATGLLDGEPRTLARARAGDVLVLTKAIGSGTILAAEMRGKASGRSVMNCLGQMSRIEPENALALAEVATAMTDVTGFGLAGHAHQMALASDVTLEIALDDVPLLEGAAELAKAGIHSTLLPSNKRAFPIDVETGGKGELLFDPQTSGGFLASVPPESVASLSAIHVIGRCIPKGRIPVRVA